MAATQTTADIQLVPADTRVEASGEGQAFEVPPASARLFLIRMDITEIIEQESLELSIWGSADGQDWASMPLLKLPQQFYRGTTQMVLDLALRSEVKFLRARWELNRWGRGVPRPHFCFGVVAHPLEPRRA